MKKIEMKGGARDVEITEEEKGQEGGNGNGKKEWKWQGKMREMDIEIGGMNMEVGGMNKECFQHLVEPIPGIIKGALKKGVQTSTEKVCLMEWPLCTGLV